MVEIQCAGGESTSAIGAWPVPEIVEHSCLCPPGCALPGQVARRACRPGRPSGVPTLRSNSVTVGAHDVAFRDLCKDRRARAEHGAAGSEAKLLLRAFPMIEVHRVRV